MPDTPREVGLVSNLPAGWKPAPGPPLDSSRSVLEFVHRLLFRVAEDHAHLAGLLEELSAAFTASAAGLATFPEGVPLSIHPAPPGQSLPEAALPWREQSDLIERLLRARGALTVPRSAGGSYLVTVLGTPERGGWLLWLEDAGRTQWSESEGSLLVLVGLALTHRLTRDETRPPWTAQLDRALRRQRMDAAARVVRRLAHDFGNVLTGILGFSELALGQQLTPSSPLHAYLSEVHRSAQNGAQYTSQLRLFARRQATSMHSCDLAAVLAEEEKRLQSLLGANVQLKLDLPANLPAVAVESEPLRQALAVVLDNAREAITGAGVIEVSVRIVSLNALEAQEFFGDVRPGTHLEIRVADTGSGLTAEAQRQLFAEPFFSTKPRKRGFGLAMAYGILSAYRGGLELLRRSEGGTIARLVLPVAGGTNVSPVQKPGGTGVSPVGGTGVSPVGGTGVSPVGGTSVPPVRKERILVVDDDPMILQLIATTLERAGYRVLAVGSAEEALKSYRNAAGDPFRLVLSDVLMPDINGIDLARRLLAQDANVSVLFMSGQVPVEIMHQAFGLGRFELLSKPFRPEGLIRAVRAAIDRTAGMRNVECRMQN
jgi:signal transduction histidine kinase/ActR/RegA family two-component response regulator